MAEFRGKKNKKNQRFQRVRTTACNMKKINQELHHVGKSARKERKILAQSQRDNQYTISDKRDDKIFALHF